MFGDVLLNFSHGIANVGVGVENLMVLLGVPVGEGWKFLGNGLEKTNNDTNWSALHVVAELVNGSRVLRKK